MHRDQNLLIVGGAGRNVGKTELVCRLIEKVSTACPIYALKVSAVLPDETIFHGDHSGEGAQEQLFEETRHDSSKDTSRMLRAGARRVFYLRGEDNAIASQYTSLRRQLPQDSALICESNSLAGYVLPGIHIMVKTAHAAVKPRARKRMALADLIITSDGISGFKEVQCIHYHPDKHWYLSAPL